jgi:hypothetical protein
MIVGRDIVVDGSERALSKDARLRRLRTTSFFWPRAWIFTITTMCDDSGRIVGEGCTE